MALEFIQPLDKYQLNRGVIDRRAVIDHLRQILKVYAMKPGFSKFYIGITSDPASRLSSHQKEKPHFKLMIPIYEEQRILLEGSFDLLEREAITACRAGISHPETGRVMMTCENGPGGARPKAMLYILVG